MDITVCLLVVLVGILYLKWILVIILYPFQMLWGLYQRHKKIVLLKFLAVPNCLIERCLLSGGGERFLFFHISTLPSVHFRKWLYRGLGVRIGKHVVIHFKTEIRAPYKLDIGRGTIVGDNVILDARSGLKIGQNVNFSSNASVYTLQHDHRSPSFECFSNRSMGVQIDDRVWIGSNVIILPGVHIGEGAVCCAGCVVTKNVEPFTVVAGIPAKKVGERPKDLIYEFKGKSCRFY